MRGCNLLQLLSVTCAMAVSPAQGTLEAGAGLDLVSCVRHIMSENAVTLLEKR